jgi:large subunit ribosomal protein L22
MFTGAGHVGSVQMSAVQPQEVRAAAKWLRISPRKARLVVEHIRGRTVPEARTVLAFTDRAAAREVEKLLRSAVSNAEANHGLIGDDLVVKTAFVDAGPVIKRWRPRARGRSAQIRKRTCHITVTLVPGMSATVTRAAPPAAEEKPKRARRKAAPKAKAETKQQSVAEQDTAAEDEPQAKAQPKPKATTTKKKTPAKKKESES